MRKLLFFLLTAGLVSCVKNEHKEVFTGTKALIHRVVPQIENQIIIDSIAPDNGRDVFEIYSEGDKIVLAGSSPVAAASALNWYLKYFCHCHYARAGSNMDLPKELPAVKEKIKIASPYKYRYWLNYCTFNYTMSFWDWEKWQHELDWMAMQGINLVLAINGSEEVWQNTMKKWNFSDKEISDFICGPAYQAWWLMGNLEGWGGPVSHEWIKSRTTLQKNIVAYLKEMKMEPVYQGFYGMVPTSLKAKFPKADIRSTGEWNKFIRPDFIMPTDSSFHKFAQDYYVELEKLYGKAKFYGGDPFHEGAIIENADLTACGASIQKEMQIASEGSTWVLQGWIGNPQPKMLAGLDKDKTLVLDLFGETLADWNKFEPSWKISNGYSGCRWIWCTVTNFGGRNGLHGKIDSTTNLLREARESKFGKRLEGIGVMPEGSHINPFMFDYFFELGWRDSLPEPAKWAEEYSVFRYGKDLPEARKAWNGFSRTVYNIPMRFDEPQNILCAKPSLNVTKAAPWGTYPIHYDHNQFVEAVKTLLSQSETLKDNNAYQYDVADMTRQCILGELEYTYKGIIKAINSKDKSAFKEKTEKFISLAKDEERLVSTRPEFLLGRWIADAHNIASEKEKQLFEWNARMIITTWGYGVAHKTLYDYTHHEWAGLIGTYYLPRWEQFFSDQEKILNGQKPATFDYDAFEEAWTKKQDVFPAKPSGNTIEIAKEILEKYFK